MKKITQEELNEIIKLHMWYVLNVPGGSKANFEHTDLSGLTIESVHLDTVSFNFANLEETRFIQTSLKLADFNQVSACNTSFLECGMQHASFVRAKLKSAQFCHADLDFADFNQAILTDTQLIESSLNDAEFDGATLGHTDFFKSDLRNIRFGCADIKTAMLWDVLGDNKHIITLQTPKYTVNYTAEHIQIGCKKFTHDEWKNFTDEEIDDMAAGALRWWRKHKEWLFATIEMNPAQ